MNGVDVTHVVYDEAIEFFKDRAIFPGTSDALAELQRVIIDSGRQFGKAMENFRESLHKASYSAMDFNRAYVMSPAERERQKQRERRERFLEQRAACLHGVPSFPIHWTDEAVVSIGGHL